MSCQGLTIPARLAEMPSGSKAAKAEAQQSSRIFPSESLQDWAIFSATLSRAGGDERGQAVSYLLESGNPPLDVGELYLGGSPDTPDITLCRKCEQIASLVEAEAERLRTTNEAQPRELELGVLAVSGGEPSTGLKQSRALVVAHGVDPHPGLLCQGSNTHRLHGPVSLTLGPILKSGL